MSTCSHRAPASKSLSSGLPPGADGRHLFVRGSQAERVSLSWHHTAPCLGSRLAGLSGPQMGLSTDSQAPMLFLSLIFLLSPTLPLVSLPCPPGMSLPYRHTSGNSSWSF